MNRLLGLDIGEKRIGVAISDELGMIASPLVTINATGNVLAEMRTLIAKYDIPRIIVGLPVGLSGREGPQAKKVRAVADALAADLGIDIVYSDERLSSTVAEAALISQGTRRDKRKQHIDSMAAAVILQGYLENQRWKSGR
jgi:putative Holliday junction resolvase